MMMATGSDDDARARRHSSKAKTGAQARRPLARKRTDNHGNHDLFMFNVPLVLYRVNYVSISGAQAHRPTEISNLTLEINNVKGPSVAIDNLARKRTAKHAE